MLEFCGIRATEFVIDPSVVRGLEYYTGPVFEAELTAPIKDERGQPIRLGSVVSGGRYDGLVERFTGEKVPATGISIGVSRLLFGLQRLGKFKTSATQGPVVVLVLDRDRIADYQKMAQDLRQAGIRAELYLGESGMKAQMKYADRRGSPCVVIQGGDEKAKGEVQIKDLVLGATLTSIEDREEYLKKQAEAQFAVPENRQLVDARSAKFSISPQILKEFLVMNNRTPRHGRACPGHPRFDPLHGQNRGCPALRPGMTV